jgi:hypothetical protein
VFDLSTVYPFGEIYCTFLFDAFQSKEILLIPPPTIIDGVSIAQGLPRLDPWVHSASSVPLCDQSLTSLSSCDSPAI